MRSDNPSWFSWPFARLWNRTQPNADRPVAIVGPDLSQPQPSNIDIAIVPRGTGALLAQVPDGTSVGGDKRGPNATDFQTVRGTSAQVASGDRASIGGGGNNTSSGLFSVVAGGSGNTTSATAGTISGGSANTGNGSYAIVGGGLLNNSGGTFSSTLGGSSNTASGAQSSVGGGQSNVANGENSVIPGGSGGNTRSLSGRFSFSSGTFSASGDAQCGIMVLRRVTSDNTPTSITSTGLAVSSTNIPVLPFSSFYAFRVQVACIQSAGASGVVGDSKAWEIVGGIKRGGATAMVGTPTITVIAADTSLGTDNTTGAIIAVAVDTTNGGLLINVTGETSKTLRWVATVHTTEVDY